MLNRSTFSTCHANVARHIRKYRYGAFTPGSTPPRDSSSHASMLGSAATFHAVVCGVNRLRGVSAPYQAGRPRPGLHLDQYRRSSFRQSSSLPGRSPAAASPSPDRRSRGRLRRARRSQPPAHPSLPSTCARDDSWRLRAAISLRRRLADVLTIGWQGRHGRGQGRLGWGV
jgi:hypothetical protein